MENGVPDNFLFLHLLELKLFVLMIPLRGLGG